MMSLVWSKYEENILCTYILTKHKEILEQKESLILPLLFMMSLVWRGNLLLNWGRP